MSYRVTWNAPFDEWQEFPTELEAKVFAVAKSGELGEAVAVCEVDQGSDADSEPATGDLRASEGSGRVVGPTEGKA